MTQCTTEPHITEPRASQVLSSRNIVAGSSTLLALLITPSLAQAHLGHMQSAVAHSSSFLTTLQSGLMHPITGFDHLFLAVGMGLLFYGLKKQRLGIVSLTAGLSLGVILTTLSAIFGGIGLAALFGLTTGFIDAIILLSVVVLAIALISQRSRQDAFSAQTRSARTPSIQQLSLFGFGGLAVFHGIAHAMEVPANVGVGGQLGFYTGMMITMLALYTVGTLISQQLQPRLGGSLLLQRGLVVLGLGAVFIPVLT